MPVLERSELEASPLADLHAIADQVGIEGFKRLRKAELIDKILAAQGNGDGGKQLGRCRLRRRRRGGGAETHPQAPPDPHPPRHQTRRGRRGAPGRRGGAVRRAAPGRGAAEEPEEPEEPAEREEAGAPKATRPRSRSRGRARAEEAGESPDETADEPPAAARGRRGRSSGEERSAEGVVEVLANGSAFLRVNPPEQSPDDLYISSAQVRRCELVSGDRVSGPVRTPRRSERYASLLRIETINGAPADEVAAGTRYEDLPADWPSERLALAAGDPTLEAIEWLTPFGRGSRVVIAGGRFAGKSEVLRQIAVALQAQPELTLSVALVGVRPEEITQWQDGSLETEAALNFAASADTQAQALERVLETARRTAARGGHAVVLIDTLDGLHPPAARKALASARNLRDGGSLTVIATATAPFGGETTVIALDPRAASAGRQPIVDLIASGTLRPDLLVGEDGAAAITRARASALED